MKSNFPTYFYPNSMGRIVLMAMEEIIGYHGFITILDLASLNMYIDAYSDQKQNLKMPFEHISSITRTLEDVYGSRGGRGISFRIGRACLKYSLREFGSNLGLSDLTFRLMPLPKKLECGSKALAAWFNQVTDQRVDIDSNKTHIYWHINRCPLCWGRTADSPCCHLAVGLLQEALYWLSGGKFYLVEEKTCIARGDSSCTIEIEQNPVN